ncbi:MAG: sulfatase [Pirellulaceae bacterium]|nr:sulfatase [Pirellulaceae bacterium]
MNKVVLLLVALLVGPTSWIHAAPPNVILILADDLGWADLGCYEADLHETPHLDRLSSEGVRFTQAYAMSVCSPTRAMLLTGRHAARLGITVWIEASLQQNKNQKLLDASSLHDLPHTETTLATRLRDAGYFTALVGKWHLGDARHFPETHGFDVNIGGNHWGAPQTFWWPYRGSGQFGNEYRYVPHLEYGKPGEYLTDRLTDEALHVMDHAKANHQPFFLYLAHHAPHTPIEGKPDYVKHFTSKIRPEFHHQNPVYAAMVKSLDDSVGSVLTHLREQNLEENTIVIFTSDNGGYIGVDRKAGQTIPVTNNAPLRSGKGSLYEGGIRVPLLVRWPGVTPSGKVCSEAVSLADFFPTLTNATVKSPNNIAMDGLDIAALLKHPDAKLDRDGLFFHYPHYYATTTPASAVRTGDWKLIEYFEDGRVELFNLKTDPGEQNDLAESEPKRVAELRMQLDRWRSDIAAKLPQVNPNFKRKQK